MKKFEIKMFDVNSKVRTLTQKADHANEVYEDLQFHIDVENYWILGVDGRLINLSNIVEITSIEEVKEEEI